MPTDPGEDGVSAQWKWLTRSETQKVHVTDAGSSEVNGCVASPTHAKNATAAWNLPLLSTRILG